MRSRSILLVVCGGMAVVAHPQDQQVAPRDFFIWGPGVGIDHGGFGLRFEFLPEDHIALFAGIGYAFAGVGFNGGVIVRALPRSRVSPYVTGMYGYNTVVIREYDGYKAFYFGPSIGAGLELWNLSGRNCLRVGAIVPFRSEDAPTHGVPPVLFSVGIHFRG